MKHPIMRALSAKGLSVRDAATCLDVDPKTIQRWCAGRIPYRANRAALSRLTGWSEHDLWPESIAVVRDSHEANEIRLAGLDSATFSSHVRYQFLARAKRAIGIISHVDYSPLPDAALSDMLSEKSKNGVEVRILLLGAKSGWAAEFLRCSNLVYGYSFMYQSDENILVCPNVYGVTPLRMPLFHLQHLTSGDLAGVYIDSLDRLWKETSRSGDLTS